MMMMMMMMMKKMIKSIVPSGTYVVYEFLPFSFVSGNRSHLPPASVNVLYLGLPWLYFS
jgi:hypothetical protein